jgi:hypothetical protein
MTQREYVKYRNPCAILRPVFTITGTLLCGGGSVESSFPKCQRCKTGDLVPLSDFGSQGAAIHYKAWACTNPECGYNIKIRNGDIYMDEPIASGMMHAQRTR